MAREVAAHLGPQATVAVLSGSGMSAESGIPTFRDAQTGIWSKFRPEDLATPAAFTRDPGKVWRWYQHRRKGVMAAQPHAGHRALVRLEAMVASLVVITQNVDGLHQRSGSGRVLELHGNILRSVCSTSRRLIDPAWIAASGQQPPPSPHINGAYARPDVVWFGEALPGLVLDEAVAALESCSVCIAVGTSAVVQPAAGLPRLAKRSGALLVEINPQRTPLSRYADYCLREPAGIALTAMVAACEP
ncbi:MAG: NAD-dependent deacylase [Gammaproteobacteria bacterium]|nr:NAD-dependent deacylase [Gammaproteobacteria bacterium]